MREYGRLHTSFWTSEDIKKLGDDGRLLAAYLVTGPHSNMIGAFRLPDAYVAEDLGWTAQRVSEGFRNLFRNGFATHDRVSKWVVVHRYLKWNPIENPNQAKAAVKLFEQIPVTAAKHWIALALSEYPDWIHASRVERFLNPSATVGEPSRNQDQDQDQEQDQEQDPELRDEPPAPAPVPVPEPLAPKPPKVTKPKAPKPTPAEPTGNHALLIAHYFATFERVRGVRPAGFGSREGGAAAKLISALGLTEAKRRIDVAFADAFWSAKVTINHIANEPDKFATASLPGMGRAWVQPPPKPGEPTWTEKGPGTPEQNPENWIDL